MLDYHGELSLVCYLGTIISFLLVFVPNFSISLISSNCYTIFLTPLLFYLLINIIITCLYKAYNRQIAIRAAFLGFVFAVGCYVYWFAPLNVYIFGIYMCVMSFFHYSEFLCIAIIQPKELSTSSFLLYHSHQYVAAAIASWIEFALESYFIPDLKKLSYISYLGLVVCLCGEGLRKAAMLTANSNFNHLVQCTKSDDHVLVTHGIYSYFRHPSYVGWFYWSIGTQITLINPICVLLYTLASWKFFNERVNIEEITLLSFFGQQYCDYQQQVKTGLPFIEGYVIRP